MNFKKSFFLWLLLLIFLEPASAQKPTQWEPPKLYNSCGHPPEAEPIPSWYKTVLALRSEAPLFAKMMQVKSFNVDFVIRATSGSQKYETITYEAAENSAWENARKQMFDANIDEFEGMVYREGTTINDSFSLKKSFFQFMS